MKNCKGTIIKSGSCLAPWQISAIKERGENWRMDFKLSDDGVLTVSGNTLLSSVPATEATPYYDEPEGEPSGWSDLASQFEDLDFNTVIIEEGVKVLGEQCFKNCKGLRKIVLPENMPAIRSSFAEGTPLEYTVNNNLRFLGTPSNPYYYLMGCDAEFNEEMLVIPEGTVRVADAAFRNKRFIKEVVFPASLEFVGWYSFEGTSVREITIPEGKLATDETLIAFDGNPGAPLETISLPYSMFRAYKEGLYSGFVENWIRTSRIIFRNSDDTIAEILDPNPWEEPENNDYDTSSDDEWLEELLKG